MPDSKQVAGDAFEEEIAELLRFMGFEVERNRWLVGRQTDLVARRNTFPDKQEFLIECKGWNTDVPMKVITDMHARVDAVRRQESPGAKGWIIAKTEFALNAKEHALSLGILCSTYQEILSRLINFRSYVKKFIDEFEHLSERFLNSQGLPISTPMVDLLLRCDLHKYYVSLDMFTYEFEPGSNSTRRRVTTERKHALNSVFDWLGNDNQNHLTILGDFGSGKSSFALYLTYILGKRYLDSNDDFARVPLFVPLRDYYRKLDIESLVTNLIVNQYQLQGSWPLFKRFLESGRILLILDGFDEMVTRSSLQDTLDNFSEICRLALPQTKIILTCRTHYFRDQREIDKTFTPQGNPLMELIRSRPNYQVCELAPLSESQIRELLENHLGDEEARSVLGKMRNTYNLLELAKRPVLCDMIIKTLPQLLKKGDIINPAQLYDAYTSDWIETDDWRSIMTPQGKKSLMRELAYNMYFHKGREAQSLHYTQLPPPREEFFKLGIRYDPKAFDLYDYDTRTCTFLTRDSDGNYRFSHRSFQEFFVAKMIFNCLKVNTIDSSFCKKSFSVDVCNFVAQLASVDPDALATLCTWAFDETNVLAWNAINVIPFLKSFNPKTVVEHLLPLCQEKRLKSGVTWVLGELGEGTDEVISLLEDALENSNRPAVWWEASFALKKLGAITDPLSGLIRNLPSEWTFDKALVHLRGATRADNKYEASVDQRAVVAVVKEYRERTESKSEIEEAISSVFSSLDLSKDRLDRRSYYAVWLLGELRVTSALPDLLRAARHDLAPVRNMAAEALGKFGRAGSGDDSAHINAEVIGTLKKLLNDSYYRTRLHAAESIRNLRASSLLSDLKDTLEREPLSDVGNVISEAIQSLEGSVSIPDQHQQ